MTTIPAELLDELPLTAAAIVAEARWLRDLRTPIEDLDDTEARILIGAAGTRSLDAARDYLVELPGDAAIDHVLDLVDEEQDKRHHEAGQR